MTIKNSGSSSVSGFKVEFDVPSSAHCTNDAVPVGAVLSPLTGSGTSAYTTGEPLRVHLERHQPVGGGQQDVQLLGQQPELQRRQQREGRPHRLPVIVGPAARCMVGRWKFRGPPKTRKNRAKSR